MGDGIAGVMLRSRGLREIITRNDNGKPFGYKQVKEHDRGSEASWLVAVVKTVARVTYVCMRGRWRRGWEYRPNFIHQCEAGLTVAPGAKVSKGAKTPTQLRLRRTEGSFPEIVDSSVRFPSFKSEHLSGQARSGRPQPRKSLPCYPSPPLGLGVFRNISTKRVVCSRAAGALCEGIDPTVPHEREEGAWTATKRGDSGCIERWTANASGGGEGQIEVFLRREDEFGGECILDSQTSLTIA